MARVACRSFRLEGRCVRRLLTDLGATEVEPDRDGDEDGGDAAQERRGVLDAHAVEHLLRKEREDGSADTTQEGVGRDGGGGKLRMLALLHGRMMRGVRTMR